MSRLIFSSALMLVILIGGETLAQQNGAPAQKVTTTERPAANLPGRTTAAYAELLARKVETDVELQILLVDYNEDSPKVSEKRFEIGLLERGLKTLEAMTGENLTKMTPAFGKLYVGRIKAETELKMLSNAYGEDHPLMKKAQIRFNVYAEALKKLL